MCQLCMDTFIGDGDGQLMVCCNMWHIHNDIHLYCNCCSASSRCNGYIQKNVSIDDFDFVKSLDIYRKWFKASTQKYEPNKSLDTKIQPKAECPKAESNCIKKESDLILSWHIYPFIILFTCVKRLRGIFFPLSQVRTKPIYLSFYSSIYSHEIY